MPTCASMLGRCFSGAASVSAAQFALVLLQENGLEHREPGLLIEDSEQRFAVVCLECQRLIFLSPGTFELGGRVLEAGFAHLASEVEQLIVAHLYACKERHEPAGAATMVQMNRATGGPTVLCRSFAMGATHRLVVSQLSPTTFRFVQPLQLVDERMPQIGHAPRRCVEHLHEPLPFFHVERNDRVVVRDRPLELLRKLVAAKLVRQNTDLVGPHCDAAQRQHARRGFGTRLHGCPAIASLSSCPFLAQWLRRSQDGRRSYLVVLTAYSVSGLMTDSASG